MHGPGFATTQENMRIRNLLARTNQSERRLPGDSDSLLYILRVSESLPYIYILLVGDCERLAFAYACKSAKLDGHETIYYSSSEVDKLRRARAGLMWTSPALLSGCDVDAQERNFYASDISEASN